MITNYLTFTVEQTSYAVDVSAVLEVLNFTEPTAVPCSLPYIEGLIFSRESGITVLNFRKRFNLSEKEIDGKTKVIVIEMSSPVEENQKIDEEPKEQKRLYGLVTDSVQDVIRIYDDAEEVKNAKCDIPQDFIVNVLKYQDKPLFILDEKKLFEEASSVKLEKPKEE